MSGTREEKIVESNRLIECTGCIGVQSAFVTKTPTVFVKKQPIATLNDVKPNDNIINFSGTCIFNFKPCLYAPKGTWQKSRETITAKKQQPLTEISSYLECAQGGKITFVKTPDAWDSPENIVDKAQSKINSAVNSITQKATEVTQAASDAIGSISDTAKKAGGFLKNESVSNALEGISDFIDDIDRKKAGLDVNVANLDIRLSNLRAELKQLLTGQQQELKDLMTLEDVDQTKETKKATSNDEKTNLDKKKEKVYSQDYFNQANKDAVTAFLTGIETDINTLNDNASRLDPNKDYNIKKDEDSADSTRLITSPPTPQVTENSIATNSVNKSKSQTQNIVDQIDQANKEVKEFGVKAIDPQSELAVRQSLAILNDLTNVINKDGIHLDKVTNIPTVSQTINVYRGELDSIVQAKIDELLKEIEYADKLKKYNEESKDLQKDLDNAAAALDVLGDFDAFIDGIAAKHLGRLANKYKETFDKLGKNMAQLNTSMQGLSYMAGGFPAGDVITNVPILEKNDGDNDDEDGSNLAGNIFGSLDDVLNDRNEEPRILRIYAIYAQDPREGEEYKKGDILETISIPPDIRVDLIIQANGMANGSIVDLDLQERSFHYKPLNKKRSSTRDGLFEDIELKGASPDFENGGSYDLTDPNYALDADGNRNETPLEDKTIIEFISRIPVEELEEEPMTNS